MAISLGKFAQFQKRQQETNEAVRWRAHIGAEGRHSTGGRERLALSPAHSSVKLTVAGQYYDGGQNYWESPGALNDALRTVICRRQAELLDEAIAVLKAREAEALLEAKQEILAVNAALEAAA